MSTHSLVARPTADGGFEGRYVHADAFPDHQIPLLLAARQYRFAESEVALTSHLIDEHPAGWDYLGADLAIAETNAPLRVAEFLIANGNEESVCMCHDWEGALVEPPMTDGDAATRDDLPWIYVLRPQGLEVISSERDPQDLRGLVLPWSADPTEHFPEERFQTWRPQSPRPVRTPRLSPPATATTVTLITKRPRTR